MLEDLLKRFPELKKFFPELPAKPDAPKPPGKLAPGQPAIRVIINGKELPPDQIKIQILPSQKQQEPSQKKD